MTSAGLGDDALRRLIDRAGFDPDAVDPVALRAELQGLLDLASTLPAAPADPGSAERRTLRLRDDLARPRAGGLPEGLLPIPRFQR